MKLRLTTFAAVVLLLTGLSGFAQDFDSVYPDTEFAVKFGPQLYYGAIRPVWTGPDQRAERRSLVSDDRNPEGTH